MDELIRFLKDEDGATALEYGLIAGLIAAFIVGAVTVAGTAVSDVFDYVGGKIDGAIGS